MVTLLQGGTLHMASVSVNASHYYSFDGFMNRLQRRLNFNTQTHSSNVVYVNILEPSIEIKFLSSYKNETSKRMKVEKEGRDGKVESDREGGGGGRE
jgi:hypothetical protein